ncbi:hypothetical protein MB02_16405 [Croceicoccus estronivorus]|uniref:hypothetical protein n=1 Tax=Croceicoccus estronivorus TaxID=1172626 RepID=UPI00082C7D35|nr:hypothetical protein [Croceicoccus estronivorus]OCC22518.1 hypothetical protein MB02_16405 [Croceicoccus estronivorus]
MPDFSHFAAIDWSGAIGERQRGIAVALCDADGGPPRLIHPTRRWTRAEVLEWLLHEMPLGTLVGVDLGISLPFADRNAFFPGWDASPRDARALWAMVDQICRNDEHLSATSFVDHPEASHYFRRHGGREGRHFSASGHGGGQGRFRVTEHAQRHSGCKPYSNFNLVGAAQVGKSSLTGMRMLHRLDRRLPIWPIDPLPSQGSALVEIYTSLAAIAAHRSPGKSKMRSYDELNEALITLGSPPLRTNTPITDHSADALLTAVWLRNTASREELWHPPDMTDAIACTEGWTFGAI